MISPFFFSTSREVCKIYTEMKTARALGGKFKYIPYLPALLRRQTKQVMYVSLIIVAARKQKYYIYVSVTLVTQNAKRMRRILLPTWPVCP
jgi:hypothetical protein